MSILPALALGLVLGARHATDADHIAAIGTLVADGRSPRSAALTGAAWGVGHSTSVVLVGGALVLLRLPMPVRLALALEFLAALMLVALGIRSIVLRHRRGARMSHARPLIVGVVHGLAGSAVLALLVLGTTTTALGAGLYLACFCIGTIIGMSVITAAFALPSRLAADRMLVVERAVRVAAGMMSIAIGLAMAHRIGVRDGLFAATPNWRPE